MGGYRCRPMRLALALCACGAVALQPARTQQHRRCDPLASTASRPPRTGRGRAAKFIASREAEASYAARLRGLLRWEREAEERAAKQRLEEWSDARLLDEGVAVVSLGATRLPRATLFGRPVVRLELPRARGDRAPPPLPHHRFTGGDLCLVSERRPSGGGGGGVEGTVLARGPRHVDVVVGSASAADRLASGPPLRLDMYFSGVSYDRMDAAAAAAAGAIGRRLSLIQGPPGTGKTRTAAAALAAAVVLRDSERGRATRGFSTRRALACAASNVAADNLLEALLALNVSAVRVGHRRRRGARPRASAKLAALAGEHGLDLNKPGVRDELQREALLAADVVVCTTVGAGCDALAPFLVDARGRKPPPPLDFGSASPIKRSRAGGASFLNKPELDALVGVVASLLATSDLRAEDIGVITPYAAQRRAIADALAAGGGGDVEVNTVDAYQGREKDVIIISTVRSNARRTLGFVRDDRRMNVALTHARRAVVLVGDPATLREDDTWRKFIHQCTDDGCVLTPPDGAKIPPPILVPAPPLLLGGGDSVSSATAQA
ncbi:hypothetical protein JL721_9189 [Aureococcus anophagefferens]|nr:hypothetical protein JL721_9189 [Aureococcus anophagefferens]